jgi:hypothetical protein
MPPLRRICARRVGKIMYCFGDASGAGLAGALIWGERYTINMANGVRPFQDSSNYR